MNEYTGFPNPSIPVGSVFYYSIRFSPASHRPVLAQLYAWRQVMIDLRDRSSDPGVAQRKLDWWQKDLADALSGRGRHPLTQALARSIRDRGLPLQPLQELYAAVAAELRQVPCPSAGELMESAVKHTGGLAALGYRACGGKQPEWLEVARRLGGYVRLTELIQNLGQDLRRGGNPLPEDLLRDHGLTQRLPRDPAEAARWQPVLAELSATCEALYQTAQQAVEGKPDPALRPLLRWAAISRATLREIADSGFDLFEQRISLPALRMLWIAWRR